MGPAYYILAILGCGEGEVACEQVAVASTHYASVEDCNAATESTIMQHSDAAYPVVVAQCRRADSKAAATLMPASIDLPEPEAPTIERAVSKPVRFARR